MNGFLLLLLVGAVIFGVQAILESQDELGHKIDRSHR